MKSVIYKLGGGLFAAWVMVQNAAAQATEYFELPATFSENATLTIVSAFGIIPGVLVYLWVARKMTKTTNRT